MLLGIVPNVWSLLYEEGQLDTMLRNIEYSASIVYNLKNQQLFPFTV